MSIISKFSTVAGVTTVREIVDRVRSVIGNGERVALHEPEFRGNELAYVRECITTGWVSSAGAFVEQFESMVAGVTGTRFAVATVNGTGALHIALVCVGVAPGDEVMMPSLTFVGTANAVVHAGGVPHFIDVDAERLSIDPESLRERLEAIGERRDGSTFNRETGRRISAVVPVHVFGHPADMEALSSIAGEWNLAVVEDAAEAIGSSLHGRACGSFGRLGVLSFNGNKIVTTGGGGAVVTNDENLARRVRHLTTTARIPHQWSFVHDEVGWNYRLPNLNAALGCAQLEGLEPTLVRKRELARRYMDAFNNMPGADILREPLGSRSNYWLVALRLAAGDVAGRDALLDALNAEGIQARPLWVPMHKLRPFVDSPRGPLTHTELLETNIVNLPSSPALVASE